MLRIAGFFVSADKARSREPPPRFAGVLDRRKSGTRAWKVIPFMLLILGVLGWQTCDAMKVVERDDQRREQQLRDEHQMQQRRGQQ